MNASANVTIGDVAARAYTVPTDGPESDGTYEWSSTTCVVVRMSAEGQTGLGYTYTHSAAAALINEKLADVVRDCSALSPQHAWNAMRTSLRNTPCRGLAMFAVSAVDTALWDLKARLLGVPLVDLLGRVRDGAACYASGGFTSYSLERLAGQLGGWAREGFSKVKMKVGREPDKDEERVAAARDAVGDADLFVDANGAYSVERASDLARRFGDLGVSWFEEPRPSDDPAGLATVRRRAPAGMSIAAGEYAERSSDAAALAEAGAIDVMQPDITRCGGFTGLTAIASVCAERHLPLSMHCAPALSAQAACAFGGVRHIERFHDHVRVEQILFDGLPRLDGDRLIPDRAAAGNGLTLREADARRFEA